jgi:hypothetical protein
MNRHSKCLHLPIFFFFKIRSFTCISIFNDLNSGFATRVVVYKSSELCCKTRSQTGQYVGVKHRTTCKLSNLFLPVQKFQSVSLEFHIIPAQPFHVN